MTDIMTDFKSENENWDVLSEKDRRKGILAISQSGKYRIGFYGVGAKIHFDVVVQPLCHYCLRGISDSVKLFVNGIRIIYKVTITKYLRKLKSILPTFGTALITAHSTTSGKKPIAASLSATNTCDIMEHMDLLISLITVEITGQTPMKKAARFYCMIYMFYAYASSHMIFLAKTESSKHKYGGKWIVWFVKLGRYYYDTIMRNGYYFCKVTVVQLFLVMPLAVNRLLYYNFINGCHITMRDMCDELTESEIKVGKQSANKSSKKPEQLKGMLEDQIISQSGSIEYEVNSFHRGSKGSAFHNKHIYHGPPKVIQNFDSDCVEMFVAVVTGENIEKYKKFYVNSKIREQEKEIKLFFDERTDVTVPPKAAKRQERNENIKSQLRKLEEQENENKKKRRKKSTKNVRKTSNKNKRKKPGKKTTTALMLESDKSDSDEDY
eukprot:248886_1